MRVLISITFSKYILENKHCNQNDTKKGFLKYYAKLQKTYIIIEPFNFIQKRCGFGHYMQKLQFINEMSQSHSSMKQEIE